MTRTYRCVTILLALVIVWLINPRIAEGWGPHGHALAGRIAAMKLPLEMPRFFRRSVDQLSYLNPEPDRWKERAESDIDKAINSASFDHYIDLEYVPAGALNLPTRHDFAAEVVKSGRKATDAGFVHFRIMELFQRVRMEFRLWRIEKNLMKKQWIEQRIINDSGLLGHFVSDASNPHHTTMHHNGWVGANPKGYTTYTRERGIHFRFEDEFVGARIKLADVLPLVGDRPRVLTSTRAEVIAYIQQSHAKLEELYILDKREPFAASTMSPDHRKFAAERLAAGSSMLRDLWWTAWVTSNVPVKP